jgi:hypothetical protein
MSAIKGAYIIEDAKSMSKEEFLDKYKHPFIVHYSSEAGTKINHEIAFSTVTAQNLASIVRQQTQAENANKAIDALYEVSKTDRNPFASKIIVGRTSTQDIVIEDLSISKFHAYFEIKDGEFTICDRGSTNGTSLNSVPLTASVPKPLKDFDIISFSTITFTFYLPESAYPIFKIAR